MNTYKNYLIGAAILVALLFFGYKAYQSEKSRLADFEKHKPALKAFEEQQKQERKVYSFKAKDPKLASEHWKYEDFLNP